ncbi:MAG: type II toxin-antitoxin system ParD family antitoxin [Bacteroidales bacterium]|nr:type II toxin-antitoxin system ParD family antitoxin [Bacteroidales bacterium]
MEYNKEEKIEKLRLEINEGFNSEDVEDFDPEAFLQELKRKK